MKHDWVAIATHNITEEEAIRVLGGEGSTTMRINLTQDRVRSVTMGCFRCEKVGEDAIKDLNCKGEPG